MITEAVVRDAYRKAVHDGTAAWAQAIMRTPESLAYIEADTFILDALIALLFPQSDERG